MTGVLFWRKAPLLEKWEAVMKRKRARVSVWVCTCGWNALLFLSVFFLFVRNREAIWHVSSEVFVLEALCTLSPSHYSIYPWNYPVCTAHQSFHNFSVTFLKQYWKKELVPKCGAIREAFVLDQSNSPCLLNVCECGPSDSSVPHLSPTALSRDLLPGLLCREEGRHPRHLPTLNSTSAFEHFHYFNENLYKKAPALHSSHSHL